MAKKQLNEIKASCSYCIYAGKEVINFLCDCKHPTLNDGYKKHLGVRKCNEFKLDQLKYNTVNK